MRLSFYTVAPAAESPKVQVETMSAMDEVVRVQKQMNHPPQQAAAMTEAGWQAQDDWGTGVYEAFRVEQDV